jgi:hypothetical protein
MKLRKRWKTVAVRHRDDGTNKEYRISSLEYWHRWMAEEGGKITERRPMPRSTKYWVDFYDRGVRSRSEWWEIWEEEV